MKIAIIGSGNVAWVLSKLLSGAGHSITNIVGRNSIETDLLARAFHANSTKPEDIKSVEADVIIVAVSDNAIQQCIHGLQLQEILLVHTAGSVSREVLKSSAKNYGVLYPLQSLRKNMDPVPSVPFLIDGNNERSVKILEEIGLSISSSVRISNDDERIRLHAAAVVVSNFTNHLYTLAEEFCIKEKVDFGLLLPLISETALRLKYGSPASLQTGPAKRQDMTTIDRHMELLKTHAELRAFYIRFTDSIINH